MAIWNLSFGGNIAGDIWQCTLHASLIGNPGGPIGPDSVIMTDIVSDVTKYFKAALVSQIADLRWVKFNEIDPVTKKYVSQTETTEKVLATPVKGTSPDYVAPQQTLCVSLLTGAKRGVAARGRFYPPATVVGYGPNGHVAQSARNALADASATFIRDLNNFPGVDLPGIAMTVIVLGYNGSNRSVTGVAVGSVMDTQRRRRNALTEDYKVVDL